MLYEADNGKHFIEQLQATGLVPDMVLLDINMPVMDGYDTAVWIRTNKPGIKVLALSMNDNENSILRMLRSGAVGYILKDADPKELALAIEAISQKGYYHSELISGKIMHAINHIDLGADGTLKSPILLTDKEISFLKLVCTELTYKEIADNLGVSPRTVDGYRDVLFEKLNLKTRVGLAMYAIKAGVVQV
ncbi:MAG: response regulator transcription factor [Ferruginibacter sp.]